VDHLVHSQASYLGSKEALFDAVVTEGGAALVAALEVPDPAAFADGDFWGRARRLLDRVVALGQREPWFTDLGRVFYLDDAPSGPGTPWAAPWPPSTPGWSGPWPRGGPAGPSATTCPPPCSGS
jgi:hypothetical protein